MSTDVDTLDEPDPPAVTPLCAECCAEPAVFVASSRRLLGRRQRLVVCASCAKTLKAKADRHESPFSYFELMPVQGPSADSIAAARLDALEKSTESLRSVINKFTIAAAVFVAVASLLVAGLNKMIDSKAETAIKETLPKFMQDEANEASASQVTRAFNAYLGAEKTGTFEYGPVKQGLRFNFAPKTGRLGVWTSQPVSRREPRDIYFLGVWKGHRRAEHPALVEDVNAFNTVPIGPDGAADPTWLFSEQDGDWAQTSDSGGGNIRWTSRVQVPVTASHLMIDGWVPSRGVHARLRVLALPATKFEEMESVIKNWKYGRPSRSEKDNVRTWRKKYDPKGFITSVGLSDGTSFLANNVDHKALSIASDDIVLDSDLLEIARPPMFQVSDDGTQPRFEEIVLVVWGVVVIEWHRLRDATVEDDEHPDFRTMFKEEGEFTAVELSISGWKSLGRGRLDFRPR